MSEFTITMADWMAVWTDLVGPQMDALEADCPDGDRTGRELLDGALEILGLRDGEVAA